MCFWMFSGLGLGYGTMKLQSIFLKKNYFMQKYGKIPFYMLFFGFTYHGYKLMEFEKRKGVR